MVYILVCVPDPKNQMLIEKAKSCSQDQSSIVRQFIHTVELYHNRLSKTLLAILAIITFYFYCNFVLAMEANIQKVRRKDAQAVPSTLFPRCVQHSRTSQTSLPDQRVDVWHLRKILLSRTLLGYPH